MDNTIAVKGVKRDISFSPFLLNKDTLAFKTNDIPGYSLYEGEIILNEQYKGIEIVSNRKRFIIKMDEKALKKSLKFKNDEKIAFKDHYNRLSSGEEEIISYISEDGTLYSKTKTSWDKDFAPYWDKMFRYFVEQRSNGIYKDNDNEEEFLSFVSDKLSKAINLKQVKVVNDGGDKYIKMKFNDFVKYLLAE